MAEIDMGHKKSDENIFGDSLAPVRSTDFQKRVKGLKGLLQGVLEQHVDLSAYFEVMFDEMTSEGKTVLFLKFARWLKNQSKDTVAGLESLYAERKLLQAFEASLGNFSQQILRAADFQHGVDEKELRPLASDNQCLAYDVQFPSGSFKVGYSNDKELWRGDTFLMKEPETINWIKAEINDQSIFWDIGSNIGLFSLQAASLNGKCKIYSFEPESQNFASLCKNIWLNEFKNVEAHNIAVSGKDRSLELSKLFISEMRAGSALHNVGERSSWHAGSPVFKQNCYCVSVDDLVEKYGLLPPTIVKLDVDGIEMDILRGAERAMKSSIKSILVEVDEADSEEVREMVEFMEGSGFVVSEKSNRMSRIGDKLPRNYIWRKKP